MSRGRRQQGKALMSTRGQLVMTGDMASDMGRNDRQKWRRTTGDEGRDDQRRGGEHPAIRTIYEELNLREIVVGSLDDPVC